MKIKTNARKIQEDIVFFSDKLFPEVKELVDEFIEDTVRDAKALAPSGHTGNLRNSIEGTSVKRKGRILASVGWGKKGFYGKFWEYGTYKLAAKPHIRPAFDQNAAKLQSKVDALIDRLWDKK